MEQIQLPMSALEIMQACFGHYKRESEKQETSASAGYYLILIEKVINGGTVELTSKDFLEIHGFVIGIFARKLVNGKVANSRWTNKQWDNVLKQIEKCYGKDETYEIKRSDI